MWIIVHRRSFCPPTGVKTGQVDEIESRVGMRRFKDGVRLMISVLAEDERTWVRSEARRRGRGECSHI